MSELSTVRAVLSAALEERIVFMAPARRLRLELVLEVVERYAGRRPIRVLDAGCGDGLLSLAIGRRHRSWNLVGADLRENLLSGARQRARARGLNNVRFERADLTQPPPETGFDVVLAVECLSEIPDDERALRMLATALVPGGLLVAHVPHRAWRPILSGSAPTWRDEVRHGYSAEEIAAALVRAGLDAVEVRPTMRATAAVAQELRDRLKSARLAVRSLAFPGMVAAVRFERWGLTGGREHALLAVARRPLRNPPSHRT